MTMKRSYGHSRLFQRRSLVPGNFGDSDVNNKWVKMGEAERIRWIERFLGIFQLIYIYIMYTYVMYMFFNILLVNQLSINCQRKFG